MTMTHRINGRRKSPRIKPYAMVGSGKLTSAIWKTGDEASGWRYRFNIFRMSANGRVEQQFRPADLFNFLKLTRVIATVLADDGCLAPAMRSNLTRLAALLDEIGVAEE